MVVQLAREPLPRPGLPCQRAQVERRDRGGGVGPLLVHFVGVEFVFGRVDEVHAQVDVDGRRMPEEGDGGFVARKIEDRERIAVEIVEQVAFSRVAGAGLLVRRECRPVLPRIRVVDQPFGMARFPRRPSLVVEYFPPPGFG